METLRDLPDHIPLLRASPHTQKARLTPDRDTFACDAPEPGRKHAWAIGGCNASVHFDGHRSKDDAELFGAGIQVHHAAVTEVGELDPAFGHSTLAVIGRWPLAVNQALQAWRREPAAKAPTKRLTFRSLHPTTARSR
ncbi:MAG: hypothetical protein EXR77_19355 [Myxococcales bacterium]|nr:hypothetical protein [Myxococcales bacterium]